MIVLDTSYYKATMIPDMKRNGCGCVCKNIIHHLQLDAHFLPWFEMKLFDMDLKSDKNSFNTTQEVHRL